MGFDILQELRGKPTSAGKATQNPTQSPANRNQAIDMTAILELAVRLAALPPEARAALQMLFGGGTRPS